MRAYRCGRAEGQFDSPILTVIDYSLPSTSKRLWVIDLASRRVLFNELLPSREKPGKRSHPCLVSILSRLTLEAQQNQSNPREREN